MHHSAPGPAGPAAPAGEAGPDGPAGPASPADFWDERYGVSERIWSGNPNAALIRECAGLAPGRALDLGCGEGADAIWLAGQGWRVVAADISRVALDRAAVHAGQAGVADRVDWQRHDLAESFPDGAFDLVCAQFLHSPVEMPRNDILRSAAAAVVPGGVLLVVGHAEHPPGHTHADDHTDGHAGAHPGAHPDADVQLPTPDEVYRDLGLTPDSWELLVSDQHEQEMTDSEGRPATRTDNTLKVRRRAD